MPRTSRPSTRRERHAWTRLGDERLLDLRFRDLGLEWRGSELEPRVAQLHAELGDRGLRFLPHCWLSDEWFSPTGVPGIAMPFYLAHPRLRRLEDRMMLEVEGGTKSWCMQLLRHEAGHAIETAFRLSRRPRWRRVFGNPSRPYPEHYRPKPFSRAYVHHLDWWYAQSHPCEDFAETFAVWLRPSSQWRRRYATWPALRKLEYVDDLMTELRGRIAPVRSRRRVDPLARLDSTLRAHYERKQARYGDAHPDFYDRDLRRLFVPGGPGSRLPRASRFLRSLAPELRRVVSDWTGEYPYTIDMPLKQMIARCRALDLRVGRPEHEVRLEAAVMLTMQTTNFLHSTDHRLPV